MLSKNSASWTDRSPSGFLQETRSEVCSVWSTLIPKVYFMPHHVGRYCANVIRGRCCALSHSFTNVIRCHCCIMRSSSDLFHCCATVPRPCILSATAGETRSTERNGRAQKVFLLTLEGEKYLKSSSRFLYYIKFYKEAIVDFLKYYSTTCVEGLTKTIRHLSILGIPEYETGLKLQKRSIPGVQYTGTSLDHLTRKKLVMECHMSIWRLSTV
jgi:hypothetical protein